MAKILEYSEYTLLEWNLFLPYLLCNYSNLTHAYLMTKQPLYRFHFNKISRMLTGS